jgi:hypothetical protein
VYCDVLVILTVSVVAVVGVTDAVESPHPVAAVAPCTTHVNVTGVANPASGVIVAVALVPSPAITVPELGFRPIVKSTPVPVIVALSPAYSGLLEFTPSVPLSGPVTVGSKLTCTAQLAPAASVVPQAAVLTP